VKWLASERRIEAAVFLLALAVRLAWVGAVQLRGGELVGPDALSYDVLAANLLEGKGLQKWDYQGLFSDPNRAIARPFFMRVEHAGWACSPISRQPSATVYRIARRP